MVGNHRRVIRADAKKVGLHGRVVSTGYAHSVAPIAGDHIVVSKGVLKEGAPDERVVVRVSDADAVLSVAQGAATVHICADEVTAQHIACRSSVDQYPGGQIAGDQVALRRPLENGRWRDLYCPSDYWSRSPDRQSDSLKMSR